MANDYVTQAEMEADRPDMGSTYTTVTTYDALMAVCATAASRYIDTLCGREPGYFYAGSAAARYFDGVAGLRLVVDDMAAAPTIVAVAELGDVDGAAGTGGTYTTWAATDYYPSPMNALAEGCPYTTLVIDELNGTKNTWFGYRRGVKITAQWGGFTAVPSDIKRATMAEATRMMQFAQQNYRDTGAIVELSKMTYTKSMHPMTSLVVAQYRKVSK